MSELKHTLRIDVVGNLPAEATKYTRAIQQFTDSSKRHIGQLSESIRGMAAGLERFGNRWTALASTASVAAMARQVATLEHRYTMLGIQAQLGADGVKALQEQIWQIARMPDIRVKTDPLLAAVESIVEKTGDLKFASENLRNIGLLIRAAGAEGAATGEIFAELEKMGITDPAAVMRSIDTLNVQGKAGAFTLANMAALGPRVITAYTATGRGGEDAIREMGAALQVIRQGTGSSEMAATAWEALLRTLTDQGKLAGTSRTPGMMDPVSKGGLGIQPWEPAGLAQGKEILRSVPDLMREILTASGGKKTVLGQWFDAEAIRSFNALSAEYQRTGKFGSLDTFLNIRGTGEQTQADSARAAKDATAALDMLSAAAERAADHLLAMPLQQAAAAIGGVSPAAQDQMVPAGIVAALSGSAGAGLAGLSAWLGTGAAATLASGAALTLGGVAAPGAAGYAAGTAAYDRGLSGTGLADAIGEGVARGMAALGSQTAADAVAAAQRARAAEGLGPSLWEGLAEAFARTSFSTGQGSQALDAYANAESAAQQAQASAAQSSAESVAASQAAQAGASAAAAEAQSAAATVAKGIHGLIRVEVTGPARVTSVSGSGPVDVEAGGAYTGKTMGEF